MQHSAPLRSLVGHHRLARALAERVTDYLGAFRRSMGAVLDDAKIVPATLTVDSETTLHPRKPDSHPQGLALRIATAT